MNASIAKTKKVKKPERLKSSEELDEDSDGLDIQFVPVIRNFKCSTSSSGIGARVMKIDQFLPEPKTEVEEEKQNKKRGKSTKTK